MPYRGFEDLDVWKRSTKLAVNVYAAFRTSRDWGIKDQVTRSAVSIPSNIAEGYERDGAREFIRFLNIAKGSAGELRTQLYIAERVGELDSGAAETLIEEVRAVSAMLQNLISSVKVRIKEDEGQYEIELYKLPQAGLNG